MKSLVIKCLLSEQSFRVRVLQNCQKIFRYSVENKICHRKYNLIRSRPVEYEN